MESLGPFRVYLHHNGIVYQLGQSQGPALIHSPMHASNTQIQWWGCFRVSLYRLSWDWFPHVWEWLVGPTPEHIHQQISRLAACRQACPGRMCSRTSCWPLSLQHIKHVLPTLPSHESEVSPTKWRTLETFVDILLLSSNSPLCLYYAVLV